jgi:uncharacterized membrane protein YhaH (DUF805 family)
MSRFSEAQNAGREKFLSFLATRRGYWLMWLPVGVTVTAVSLYRAYQHKRVADAIVAVVLWLVLFPVVALWGSRKTAKPHLG